MQNNDQTQKMIIDLSGRLGLAPKYHGDVNRAQGDPNLRYVGKDGQFADGIYNPFRKYGFISPANSTSAQCTISGEATTFPSPLRCSLYDSVNDKIILGYTTRLATGSISSGAANLTYTTSANQPSTLSDMIMYSVNGVRMVLLIRNTTLSIYDPLADMFDLNWSLNTAISNQNLTADFVAQTHNTISLTTTGYPSSGAVWMQGTTGPAVMATYTGKSGSQLTGVTANRSGTVPSGTAVYAGVTGGGVALTDCSFNRGVLADNGFVYILNSYRVHKVDGTVGGGISGQITYDVLNAPINFTFYDGVDYRGTLLLAMNSDIDVNSRLNETQNFTPIICGVYVWDRLSTIVSMRDFIPLNGMKMIRRIWISPRGEVLILAEGSNNSSYLMRYNGTGFEILETLGKLACPVTWGGLVTGTGCSYWQGIDGIIYGYGAAYPSDPDVLFKIADTNAIRLDKHPSSTSNFLAGALLLTQYDDFTPTTGYSVGLENIYGSYRYTESGTKYDTFRYQPNATDTINSITPKAAQGNVYSIVRRFPMFVNVNYVRVANLPITSSGSSVIATIKIYKDHSSTAFISQDVTQKEAHDGFVYIAVGGDESFAIQIEIEFATTAQLGVDDYCPIYAEVDYSPNLKKR